MQNTHLFRQAHTHSLTHTLPHPHVHTVTIVSEDGGGVRNINPGSVSMLLWKAQATGQRPPPEVHTTLS